MIRTASAADLAWLSAQDRHIAPAELAGCVARGRVLLAEEDGRPAGWLRWGLFWDSIPFMNLLYLLEPYRGRGLGRRLTAAWEQAMRDGGFRYVMTSTASDEYAQHFYHRLGYRTVGSFDPPGEPLELLLGKPL